MTITYDDLAKAFLSKTTEFEFIQLPVENRTEIIDGFMKRAANAFKKNCKYDLTACDDTLREYEADFDTEDVDEVIDIISEGMLVQWMKPYIYSQEVLENTLNTSDYSTYSPANLLSSVGSAYSKIQNDYTQMIREYSYNHGDLTRLHI